MRKPMFSKWDIWRMKFSGLAEVWQRGYSWNYRWYRFREFFGLIHWNDKDPYDHPTDTACVICGECKHCKYCTCKELS